MTAIHAEVTAEDIAKARAARRFVAWAQPIEDALGRLTGQSVDIDGDTKTGNVVTIGQDAWTLVIELPEVVDAWLDYRWQGGGEGDPFAFDIEVPDWVLSLVGS